MDASILLKPLLSRGELRCIGCTTLDKFRKFLEKDPGLERRFQQASSISMCIARRCIPCCSCLLATELSESFLIVSSSWCDSPCSTIDLQCPLSERINIQPTLAC